MRRLATCIFAASLASCGSARVDIATSINSFHYANARYEEKCVAVVGPVSECAATNAALTRWKQALKEADEASQRGGSFPLQVKRVNATEKEALKCLPK